MAREYNLTLLVTATKIDESEGSHVLSKDFILVTFSPSDDASIDCILRRGAHRIEVGSDYLVTINVRNTIHHGLDPELVSYVKKEKRSYKKAAGNNFIDSMVTLEEDFS